MKSISKIVVLNFKLEWSERRSYFSLLIYVLSTVYLSNLVFKEQLSVQSWNAFFWVIFLFAAVQAAYRSFSYEADQRFLLYYGWLKPEHLILGKIAYNFIYLWILALCTTAVFGFFAGFPIKDPWAFITILSLSALGFSAILTLVAGISAKAGNNPALPAILSIPLLYPQILTLSHLSERSLTGFDWEINARLILVIALLALVSLLLAFLLFPYLWRD
ncbi:heme exporter protein CcmB [Croceimicrobium sp.]|uniref:heme exporter protein CcmB n=1 Tax=Croceimicrobium sp. TaxID=2828340 RepID=UPI003BAA31B1